MIKEGLEFVLLILGLELWIDELGPRWDESLEGDLIASLSGDETIGNIDEFADSEVLDRFQIGDNLFRIFEIFVPDFSLHVSCPFLILGFFHRFVGIVVVVRLFDEESFVSRCDIPSRDLVLHRDIIVERPLSGFLDVEIGGILELVESNNLRESVELVFGIDSFVFERNVVEGDFREHIDIPELTGGSHYIRK